MDLYKSWSDKKNEQTLDIYTGLKYSREVPFREAACCTVFVKG